MRTVHVCDCGTVCRSTKPIRMTCPGCDVLITMEGFEIPLGVLMVYRLRRPGEVGVGDTIERLLGEFGKKFKRFMKRRGLDCGCTRRQDHWNKLYSYADLAEIIRMGGKLEGVELNSPNGRWRNGEQIADALTINRNGTPNIHTPYPRENSSRSGLTSV